MTWVLLVLMFGIPVLLIRHQMRRPDRPTPTLDWLKRDYSAHRTLVRLGWVFITFGASLVVGYASVRLPNAGEWSRQIDPAIEPGPIGLLLTGLAISAVGSGALIASVLLSPRVERRTNASERSEWTVLLMADALFILGMIIAVAVSGESARRWQPLELCVIAHFGLLLFRPWRW